MTTQQVADTLDVSVSTVARWVRDGRLPAIVLPSGRYRFRRDDVEALLEPVEAAS